MDSRGKRKKGEQEEKDAAVEQAFYGHDHPATQMGRKRGGKEKKKERRESVLLQGLSSYSFSFRCGQMEAKKGEKERGTAHGAN